jgi:L-cysteine/cystine lyase
MSPASLRSAFPVFDEVAYLNSGTCGPVAAASVEAAREELHIAAIEGRASNYYERLIDLHGRLRSIYAARLGAGDVNDVALTSCTSEGVVRVLSGLDLGPEDEVITSVEEHPGLTGPLANLRARFGVKVRAVGFDEVADAIGPATRLVAVSHVNWIDGRLAPLDALREVAHGGVPVLLDGAQGVGAIDFDVEALGCTFYAGSGQKWMCGPVGTGMLWVAADWRERLPALGPIYMNLIDAGAGLDAVPHVDARRHDTFTLSAEAAAFAVAAHDTVAAHGGWSAATAEAVARAGTLAQELQARGREVLARGRTTLVGWREDDPTAFVQRAAAHRIVIRELPGRGVVRASVGAWNSEDDLERLLALVS